MPSGRYALAHWVAPAASSMALIERGSELLLVMGTAGILPTDLYKYLNVSL